MRIRIDIIDGETARATSEDGSVVDLPYNLARRRFPTKIASRTHGVFEARIDEHGYLEIGDRVG